MPLTKTSRDKLAEIVGYYRIGAIKADPKGCFEWGYKRVKGKDKEQTGAQAFRVYTELSAAGLIEKVGDSEHDSHSSRRTHYDTITVRVRPTDAGFDFIAQEKA